LRYPPESVADSVNGVDGGMGKGRKASTAAWVTEERRSTYVWNIVKG
jgi:hypothetical protein